MAEVDDFSFTRADIETLTAELGEFATKLTKQQWGLLLAIFAAAANHVETGINSDQGKLPGVTVGRIKRVDDPGSADAGKLRDQLRRAYTPGRPPASIVDRVTPVKPGGKS